MRGASGYRCQTEAAIAEAGPMPVAAEVRTSLAASSERTSTSSRGLAGLGELNTDPAAAALAFAVRQTVETALLEHRTQHPRPAQAYRTGQNWLWCKHNPNRTDTIAAMSKAADAARERTAR
ncbi:hypothetical protein GCM10010232_70520 [Streptomyces amakusaensis]|uniref:Transposase n=1 Tax=Streptomyces amakusaensis TaxID=67271 RepID=A0ABW0AT85_9ACTN